MLQDQDDTPNSSVNSARNSESAETHENEAHVMEPPTYTSVDVPAPTEQQHLGPPELPSYNAATQVLPTYEEAERSKTEEAARAPVVVTAPTTRRTNALGKVDRVSDIQLGTDGMFLCTFVVSFLFNWLGLLASLCITNTIAGRFGAIAGFGLSMVKWVAILKHQNWASGVADDDSWLWWMLIVLGFLIFFRGCMQYIRIKYQWNRLGTAIQDRAYLLF